MILPISINVCGICFRGEPEKLSPLQIVRDEAGKVDLEHVRCEVHGKKTLKDWGLAPFKKIGALGI